MSKIIFVGSDRDTLRLVSNLSSDQGCEFEHYTKRQWQEKEGKAPNNVVPIKKDVFLPAGKGKPHSYLRSLDDIQQETIMQALAIAGGNVSHVSKILSIGRATLYRKIKQYDINLNRVRGDIPKKSAA